MKIKTKNAMIFLFILLLVPIEINMTIYHYSFYLKAIFSIIYFVLFLVSKPTKKEFILMFIFLIFNISTCFSDIIDKTFTIRLFFSKVYPFGLYCGVMYCLKKDYEGFLYQMRNVGIFVTFLFVIELIINIITSKPLTPILYFNRNGMQLYLLFIIGSVLLYNQVKNTKYKKIDIIVFIISISGLFISGSATSAIIGLFIIAFIFFNIKNINILYYYIFYIIIWYFLIIGRNSDNFLLQFVFKTFKKNSTFSNRLWRWDYSLEFIKSSWLWGQTNLLDVVKDKNDFFINETFNAHNGILQVFVYSGIFGITSMITLFLDFAKKVNRLIGTKFYKYIVTVVLSYLICSYTESALSNNILVLYMFILVGIFYNKKEQIKE